MRRRVTKRAADAERVLVAMAAFSRRRPWLREAGRVRNRCGFVCADLARALKRAGLTSQIRVLYSPYVTVPDGEIARDIRRGWLPASPYETRAGLYLPVFHTHRYVFRHYVLQSGHVWMDPTVVQFFGCDDVPFAWAGVPR